ncbi:Protein of unknown function (DUF619) domain containing protein [Elaphomyces granulatus]
MAHTGLYEDLANLNTNHRPNRNMCRSIVPIARAPFSNSPNHFDRTGPRCTRNYHHLGQRARQKLADREFFLSLLSSAATKREAKSYLSRFKELPPKTSLQQAQGAAVESNKAVQSREPAPNIRPFDGEANSVSKNPVFRNDVELTVPSTEETDQRLHVALVKIMTPQLLDDDTVRGIALTLSQLTRLGMASCIVLDPGSDQDAAVWRKTAVEQADRLSAAIDRCGGPEARCLDPAITVEENKAILPKPLSREFILKPLRQNHTVVIVPVGYTEETSRAVPMAANDVVLALTREFAGLEIPHPDEDPAITAKRIKRLQKEVSLDRLILLDSRGGIPAFSGPHKSHVFINLEQEYHDIEDELLRAMASPLASKNIGTIATEPKRGSPLVDNRNPFLHFVHSKRTPLTRKTPLHTPDKDTRTPLEGHLDNLRLLQQTLAILPPSSSGIITTPSNVASSAQPLSDNSQVSAVGTRRQKNLLIHNLLTDKPSYSSSLPSSRRPPEIGSVGHISRPVTRSTFFKRGMPLTVLPDPRVAPWTPKEAGWPSLTFDDPRIDLPRLIHLIEDSFNRKLDVRHYMDRIKGRIAGLIIAGEYEGGAILTWETPPGIKNDGSEASLARIVPYLDKFAVLKRSQGAGGVADIIFNAMVRSCFPHGVCWRSRQNNPVNKWYFERSRGSWKLPGSDWTMFWTTPGVPENGLTFRDYEAVCRDIQPSWADNKHIVD